MDRLTGVRDTYSDDAIRKAAKCFKRIIIWGLFEGSSQTHRHIFRAFYETCKKLDLPAFWVSDTATQDIEISPDDIVFIHGTVNRLDYLMSKGPVIVEFNARFYKDRLGASFDRLQSYDRRITQVEARDNYKTETSGTWDPLTYYNPELRYLSQPWGSDLLQQEFMPPVDSSFSNIIYWMGTWWLNEEWGNFYEMAAAKKWADGQSLDLRILGDCDTKRNALFVRQSRFAPSFGGKGQAEANYLACRMFKNISYGQFCVSNVPVSQNILDNTAVFHNDIAALFDSALAVSPRHALDMTKFQQHKIRNYTVAAHLYINFVAAIVYCCGQKGAG